MAEGGEARRDRLQYTALDPDPNHPDGSNDGQRTVFVSHTRLLAIAKRGAGQVLEARDLVPDALNNPTAVFEGLRWDEDEPKDGTAGWRCYSTTPDFSYSADGERRGPYPQKVFIVFVNDQGVAYNWRWERADPDNPGSPRSSETRFKRRLM